MHLDQLKAQSKTTAEGVLVISADSLKLFPAWDPNSLRALRLVEVGVPIAWMGLTLEFSIEKEGPFQKARGRFSDQSGTTLGTITQKGKAKLPGHEEVQVDLLPALLSGEDLVRVLFSADVLVTVLVAYAGSPPSDQNQSEDQKNS